eukprot:8175032-Alexandrium_andersonii.AAC.1
MSHGSMSEHQTRGQGPRQLGRQQRTRESHAFVPVLTGISSRCDHVSHEQAKRARAQEAAQHVPVERAAMP